MQSRSARRTVHTNGTPVASTLHALVATPAVGSVFVLFVVVGATALVLGMLSGIATHRFRARHASRERS